MAKGRQLLEAGHAALAAERRGSVRCGPLPPDAEVQELAVALLLAAAGLTREQALALDGQAVPGPSPHLVLSAGLHKTGEIAAACGVSVDQALEAVERGARLGGVMARKPRPKCPLCTSPLYEADSPEASVSGNPLADHLLDYHLDALGTPDPDWSVMVARALKRASELNTGAVEKFCAERPATVGEVT